MKQIIINIERCNQCEYCYTNDEYNSFCHKTKISTIITDNNFNNRIPNWCPLEEAKVLLNWVKCSERYPEFKRTVICRNKEGNYFIDYRWDGDVFGTEWFNHYDEDIIEWSYIDKDKI